MKPKLTGILSEDGTRALAWFANDYHGGGDSRGYRLLCASLRRLDRLGYPHRDFMYYPLGAKGTAIYAALEQSFIDDFWSRHES